MIVLPVVVLAAFGLFSLRQDRLMAQHESADRAQLLADSLWPRIWSIVGDKNASGHPYSFEVDDRGTLIFPPPMEAVPAPLVFDETKMSERQAQLWSAARSKETNPEGLAEAIGLYGEFLALEPPVPFGSVATYSQGLLLLKQGRPDLAAERFHTILEKYPTARGETGMGLRPLAEFQILFASPSNAPVASSDSHLKVSNFLSSLLLQPNLLTGELIDRACERPVNTLTTGDCQEWRQLWDQQEVARQLYAAAFNAPSDIGSKSLLSVTNVLQLSHFRFQTPERLGPELKLDLEAQPEDALTWFALPQPARSNTFSFACVNKADLDQRLRSFLKEMKGVPAYFGIQLILAGEPIGERIRDRQVWREAGYFGRRGGGVKKEYLDAISTNLLAFANGPPTISGNDVLKLNIFLTSPSALYRQQGARSFWFGSMIGVSALAALAGLWASWRTFCRQQQLSELKSNFVSSVSHELRAPIASVRLLAESLERGKIQGEQKQLDYFRFIGRECRRLSSLIENVLDFSRMDQGRRLYEFEPTDVIRLVGQTVSVMENYAAEKQVGLQFNPPDHGSKISEATIMADGRALQQVLVNLIDNAIKHSQRGQQVIVGLEHCLHNEDSYSGAGNSSVPTWIEFWVEDQGPGIPAVEHEKIFDRFYRLGSELRRDTQGVGIGLSIVKHVVEAHHGQVVIRSQPGHGSRFVVQLPVSSGKDGPRNELMTKAQPPKAFKPREGNQ